MEKREYQYIIAPLFFHRFGIVANLFKIQRLSFEASHSGPGAWPTFPNKNHIISYTKVLRNVIRPKLATLFAKKTEKRQNNVLKQADLYEIFWVFPKNSFDDPEQVNCL